jgi:hypothetical protein
MPLFFTELYNRDACARMSAPNRNNDSNENDWCGHRTTVAGAVGGVTWSELVAKCIDLDEICKLMASSLCKRKLLYLYHANSLTDCYRSHAD